jgi:signal peptidase I
MESKKSIFKELFHFIIIVLLVVLPIRLYVAQPFVVVGQSMEPTFVSNEYLIVDELSYRLESPARGQVIVFKYPYGAEEDGNAKYFIKRIIGLPGETVVIREGVVTIKNSENPKGFLLNEPYVTSKADTSMSMTLGNDQYFVMGDNRPKSFDSRSWGPLSSDHIIGKAFIRLLPPNKISLLPGNYKLNK